MRTCGERATSFVRILKQLNWFNTYSTDEAQIRREIITTRIYLILLPAILIILIIYSAERELDYTVQINNPTLDTYQQLLETYPDTLFCPCSQLSLSYSSFVTLTPQFHPVCSSDFIEDPWLSYLYHDDASFYFPFDIRSIGNAQFQLLRDLCQLSKEIIDDTLQTVFTSSVFVDSRGMLLTSKPFEDQVQAFVKDFTINIASEQRRQQTLFTIIFYRNFLASALETASSPIINTNLNLKMNATRYQPAVFDAAATTSYICTCDATYSCEVPLGITYDSYYDSNYWEVISQTLQFPILVTVVNGFQAGCLPFNSLLSSTLECYNNRSCLDNIISYFPSINQSFHILNTSLLNQSIPTTLISTLADQLMVEDWSTEINYSQYFTACHPISCSYTYVQRFSILYIFTTVVGLLGGVITILRILCPQITKIFYRIKHYILLEEEEEHQPRQERIQPWLSKMRQKVTKLNLFSRRNSSSSNIQEQIFTTRFYIICLIAFTLIFISITTFEQRTTTTIISMPTIDQFENLYQTGKLPHSCSCSQIANQRSQFISLTAIFHQVCSSELISDDWLDRLSYTTNVRSAYYYLDIRSYGLDMFRTILTFCSLVNETTIDAIDSFLAMNLITTQVLSRQQFNEQVQTLIQNFQLDLKNTFKQSFSIVQEINQANQVLSNRVSNFYFDGIFDNNSQLINVQTYTGTVSSINDTLPTCSCVFSQCSQQLGFYETIDSSQTYSLIVNVPGMYSACYPLDGVRISTLECWFNQTCIQLVLDNLAPFPVKLSFDSLNSSKLIRFSPDTNIGNIIDDLMIELWMNMTSYEMYYNICKPTTCSYTSYNRFNWFYTITILTSIFGGLTVSLRIICKLLMQIFFKCRRKHTGKRSTVSNELTTVRVNIFSRILRQTLNFLSTLNIFDSDSPHAHIQRRERLATRLCVLSIVSTVTILFICMLFVQHTREVTIKYPSSNRVDQLKNRYPLTLSCPCTQTAMPYSTFLSLEVTDYHPICSSSLLSQDYLQKLFGENLMIISESISFQRQFLVAQLSLLNSFCLLIEQTMNNSLTDFLHQEFITAQVLTTDQFYDQINMSINQFYLGLSFSLRNSIDYLQALTHGNAIMSTYLSNWRFRPDLLVNSSIIRTKSISYGNCSCAKSSQCSLPLTIDNVTFPGLAIGCLPSTVLLQSTLECFYDQTCLNTLHNAFFDNMTISSLPVSVNMSRYFPVNTSVSALLDGLLIERWFRQNDYETFFQTCQVSTCTYTYTVQPDIPYVVTTIIGLIGGLTVIFRLVFPFIILITMHLIDRIRKRTSMPVEHISPIPPVSTSQDTVQQVTTRRAFQWKTNRRLRKLVIMSTILVLSVIVALVILLLVKTFSLNSSMDSNSSSPITISTPQPIFNTTTVRSTFICSANATWAKEAVTVAGFANGSSSTSLAGLNSPDDLFVDEIGYMYILDAMNYRILYWPKDSTEGRVVVGTGQPGSDANQLTGPISLTIGQNQMFISDAQNYRVQAFPLTTLSGSPNGTTVLGETIVGSNRTMPIIVLAMAFDHKNKLLYVGDYFNQRLLILNITEENVEIVTDVELSIMNSSIPIYPSGIAIDESSDIYYVLDSLLNTVVKFQIGSTMGSIVAGDLISNSIYNQLALPTGLAVDSFGYLYIVDMGYNRVAQLLNDNGYLRTIAGIGFIGTASTRLTGPSSIKFDQYYNLYVVDSGNNRIQRFDLLNNGCS